MEKQRTSLGLAAAVVMAAATGAGAQTEAPLFWFDGLTGSECVIEQCGTSGVRLDECFSGFAEGAIGLPAHGRWTLGFIVQADEDSRRTPTDFVDIFINSEFVGRYVNDPPSMMHMVEHTIVGDSVFFRFEFTSGNQTWHYHMCIPGGTATLGCLADWNNDGAVDTADFFEFVAAFFADPPDADFNGDGATDTADFFEFIAAFFGPPCP